MTRTARNGVWHDRYRCGWTSWSGRELAPVRCRFLTGHGGDRHESTWGGGDVWAPPEPMPPRPVRGLLVEQTPLRAEDIVRLWECQR